MRAFFHPDQMLHEPAQHMRHGRVVPARDLRVRAERLLAALAGRGIVPETPAEQGLGPAAAVHTEGYLGFLATAWQRWVALPDHGPEVWPSTFPYWSGRPDAPARGACPAAGLMGQAGWFLGDMSVPMGPATWRSALRSCDTAVAAAAAVSAGERVAYALCRPSGHHARADRASGFCYLNNTAIAAQHLRQRYARVAVIDVDAHHGDGTQQIFYHRPDVLTVSIHADPSNYYPFFTGYPGETGHGAGAGCNANLPLPHGSGGAAMSAMVEAAVGRARAFGAEALVVALGYDAHRLDPIGALTLEAADFGRLGTQFAGVGLPTLIVQEGGYAVEAIGDCLDSFIGGFEGR